MHNIKKEVWHYNSVGLMPSLSMGGRDKDLNLLMASGDSIPNLISFKIRTKATWKRGQNPTYLYI